MAIDREGEDDRGRDVILLVAPEMTDPIVLLFAGCRCVMVACVRVGGRRKRRETSFDHYRNICSFSLNNSIQIRSNRRCSRGRGGPTLSRTRERGISAPQHLSPGLIRGPAELGAPAAAGEGLAAGCTRDRRALTDLRPPASRGPPASGGVVVFSSGTLGERRMIGAVHSEQRLFRMISGQGTFAV